MIPTFLTLLVFESNAGGRGILPSGALVPLSVLGAEGLPLTHELLRGHFEGGLEVLQHGQHNKVSVQGKPARPSYMKFNTSLLKCQWVEANLMKR